MPKRNVIKDTTDLRKSIIDIVNNLGRLSPVLAIPCRLTPAQSIKEMIDILPTETMRALCAIRNQVVLKQDGRHIGVSFEEFSTFINQSCHHVFSILKDFIINPGNYDNLTSLEQMINKAESVARKSFGTRGGLALLTDAELRKRIEANMHAVSLFRGTPEFSLLYPGSSSARIAAIHDALQVESYSQRNSAIPARKR